MQVFCAGLWVSCLLISSLLVFLDVRHYLKTRKAAELHRRTLANRTNSPLLQLAPELRNQIYVLALDTDIWHIEIVVPLWYLSPPWRTGGRASGAPMRTCRQLSWEIRNLPCAPIELSCHLSETPSVHWAAAPPPPGVTALHVQCVLGLDLVNGYATVKILFFQLKCYMESFSPEDLAKIKHIHVNFRIQGSHNRFGTAFSASVDEWGIMESDIHAVVGDLERSL
ncbi:hypothetical protein BU23DRAFT_230708 [Bimuria novae-zelandiae CBS 107.79]|uniref:Uncharacterized protein n=1 Tax=Bimuria novae-zelandiae CBS 107.79 TaxID=1447943 RepID=A0A6A5UYJ7_9PLEO|nr:hypothetical protein BU23DRAFT_230708 [Bimuria novae-zelandiae CBS 107.79]